MKASIQLFHIPNYKIDTVRFDSLLHDKIVKTFEDNVCQYVGARYACTFNSATSAIFLLMRAGNFKVSLPSIIPPVVVNAILNAHASNKVVFNDNINWVGGAYTLYENDTYKIIDSAQQLDRDQFKNMAAKNDLMIFSHYPTKPVGSCDGATVVSNNKNSIAHLRQMALNGMQYSKNNWDRKLSMIGHKMYMNSIQAYIANENLHALDAKKEKLAQVRDYYNKKLGLSNISDHLYRIAVRDNKAFLKYMQGKGIVCGIHYSAAHLTRLYAPLYTCLPLSECAAKTVVSIPFHEKLTQAQLRYVVDAVEEFR